MLADSRRQVQLLGQSLACACGHELSTRMAYLCDVIGQRSVTVRYASLARVEVTAMLGVQTQASNERSFVTLTSHRS